MSDNHRFVCVHGHFYQPPRENAWLEVIEQQEGARPWHNWNARIQFECYAPNAQSRMLGEDGFIRRIRNNYARMSFNFGPTLLSWMEHADPEAYALILEGDRLGKERYGGHGNAIAQVYGHAIMPLCNERDKVTQVYWGIRDFEHRFQRHPAGVWLAETAVDVPTLEVLAAHGIAFTILAPRQAKAIRKLGETEWVSVSEDDLDTRRPYWCTLPAGRRIAVFFYNGATARDVAFNHLLNNGRAFASRLASILDDASPAPQLAHIATDGESYGHHHRFGEMALADALAFVEDNGLAQLTNYAQFLERFPPTCEVEIHENSSWSCVHGVERWRDDCGCHTGAHSDWHQQWRSPLREALDWLREALIPLFNSRAGMWLRDPWAARNDYIQVILDRSGTAADLFLEKHARRLLGVQEQVEVFRLLEMQRHALLMYTSCGWFFDEISGIETNQILQYALRAMDYAQDLSGKSLHQAFYDRLAAAPSNRYAHGAVAYEQQVLPSRVDLKRVAMHFAVASLFESDPSKLNLYNYTAEVAFFKRLSAGTPRLAAGRLGIRSRITRAAHDYSYVVLYLGQHHIVGGISGDMEQDVFEALYNRASAVFQHASLAELMDLLNHAFGEDKFSLDSLMADEQLRYIKNLTASGLDHAASSLRSVFNDNYQLIVGLNRHNLPLPEAWRKVCSYVLNEDLRGFFQNGAVYDVSVLQRVVSDMRRWHIDIDDEEGVSHLIGARLDREIALLDHTVHAFGRLQWLNEVLDLLAEMRIKPDLWRSQNRFYRLARGLRKGEWRCVSEPWQQAFERLAIHLKVRVSS
jgi:alpha-amylase/alpha-mannosidase (GH57 family)